MKLGHPSSAQCNKWDLKNLFLDQCVQVLNSSSLTDIRIAAAVISIPIDIDIPIHIDSDSGSDITTIFNITSFVVFIHIEVKT